MISNVRFESRGNYLPNPHKFLIVTVARFEFGIKLCLTLEINQFIFVKHFSKMTSCPDKIHITD